MAAAGLGADLGVAAVAFVGTNIDNLVVTTAMVSAAPAERAHRIAAGQVAGFVVIVAVAAAAAALLYEFSPAVVGLLGLVPLAIGLHGLWGLRPSRTDEVDAVDPARADTSDGTAKVTPRQGSRRSGRRGRAADRAVGRSFTAAALVTLAAGGDNLAVYIPLFRVGGVTNVTAVAGVFIVGEVVLTALVLWGGRHPRARLLMGRVGHIAVPVLLCVIGVVVMMQAGTFGWL